MNSKRVFICAVTLVSLCIAALFVLPLQLRFASYTETQCTENTEALRNPYIGWYRIQLFQLSDDGQLDLSYFEVDDLEPSLVLLEVDLQNYLERPLSAGAEKQLHVLLSACRTSGKQAIIRFMYDSEGRGTAYEPGDISLILTHMTQAAEIINQYTDCVYILQGLFVGSWGELHTSNYTDPADLRRLAIHLDAALDSSIFLAVRTPEQWRTITESSSPLLSSEVSSGSLAARLSLFNDGMLGSETDLGTYAESETSSDTSRYGKRDRQSEIAFQNILCSYVPNGGEIVIDSPRNDLPAAISYLQQTHVSYLDRDYDEEVLNKWGATIYDGTDLYAGQNGIDYMECHLGYRYVVRSSAWIYPYPWNEIGKIAIRIENCGFSPAYRIFELTLRLEDSKTGALYSILVETDNRLWEAGQETLVEIPIEIRTLPLGTYELSLEMTDPVTGHDIIFANGSDHALTKVPLGSLRIG